MDDGQERASQCHPSREDVVRLASEAAFGAPLIVNNFRAFVVEAIVKLALPTGWRWCSSDWSGWDFEHADGTRLEVKQSSARQSWENPKPSSPRFDIAARTGRYEGVRWIADPGRNAHIYLFGFHPITDDTADHRDAGQWRFFAVPASRLPDQKGLGLPQLRALSWDMGWSEIGSAVEEIRLRD